MPDATLVRVSRTVLSVAALLFLVLFVIGTWHWPLVGDAPLMHYVVFLIRHGKLPYRDILDPNMPGTYLLEALVMRFMGPGALAWRIFDLLLLGAAGLAMVAICTQRRWFAAVFGATLFALIHGRDGVAQLGQRDLVLSVLLLFAYGCLLQGIRILKLERSSTWSALVFGLFLGLATTIKPVAVVFLPPLLFLVRREAAKSGSRFSRYLYAAVLGALLPWLAILAYLTRFGLIRDFLSTIFKLVPALTAIGHRSLAHLFLHSISGTLLPLVLLWLPMAYARRSVLTFERAALLVGVACGLLCFYAQGKGYPYHRYPSEAFLLLLIGTDIDAILLRRQQQGNETSYMGWIALAALYTGVLVIGGGSLIHALRQDWRNQDFNTLLAADLSQLGGSRLSGHVQCLDMADGCIPELYNLRLVQATGSLYDCYMLSPQVSLASRLYYQERFWKALQNDPPTVFIVTNFDCGTSGYSRLNRWPELSSYLGKNYMLYTERSPTREVRWGSSPSKPLGYRVYVRDAAVPRSALAAPSAPR